MQKNSHVLAFALTLLVAVPSGYLFLAGETVAGFIAVIVLGVVASSISDSVRGTVSPEENPCTCTRNARRYGLEDPHGDSEFWNAVAAAETTGNWPRIPGTIHRPDSRDEAMAFIDEMNVNRTRCGRLPVRSAH